MTKELKDIFGDDIELFYNEKYGTFFKAFVLVNRVFYDELDKSGKKYLQHLYSVCKYLETEEEKIIGLMHDIIENSFITEEDLLDLTFPKNIVEPLSILTKKKNESYNDYIERITISENIKALHVKKADVQSNMESSRPKYKETYSKIVDKINELEKLYNKKLDCEKVRRRKND